MASFFCPETPIEEPKTATCQFDHQHVLIGRVRCWPHRHIVDEHLGTAARPEHEFESLAGTSLDSILPLENASMPGRAVAQWDKDDCHDLGIIKVDLLGLGMMAAMQDGLELCAARGRPVDLARR